MKDQDIILIGGAPTAGKSIMAEKLSAHFDIPWISTDQIREIIRAVANKEKFPALFRNKNFSGEEFLNKYSVSEIVEMEIKQGIETWLGIKAFIENPYPWEGFVVEGVAVLPHLIARDFGNNKKIKPIFLIDEDVDRTRDVVFNRGLWGDADTYPDSVKEKEVEWALLFSQQLKKEAERFNYPCIEVKKQNDDIESVLTALGLK